jgi:hypothetical protein
VYLLTPDEPNLTRLRLSLMSLRHHDPGVFVHVVVAAEPGWGGRRPPWLDLADLVETVKPAHLRSGYFQDNCCHLRQVESDQVLYLDTDTIVFGSVTAMARKFADVDVAACANRWVFKLGYSRAFAPEIETPLNGGVALMSQEFCRYWAQRIPERHESLLTDPSRAALARWLRSVSRSAYHRHEFVLSEAAWNGMWSVGVLQPRDCYILPTSPDRENPELWLQSTILHTFGHGWLPCIRRLQGERATPDWLLEMLPV